MSKYFNLKIKYTFFFVLFAASILSVFVFKTPTSQAAHQCNATVMTAAGFSGTDIDDAIAICLAESGGVATNDNTLCLSGAGPDYSIGLFQMNLYVNFSSGASRCVDGPAATAQPWASFHDESPSLCTVSNQAALDQCADYYGKASSDSDTANAIENAMRAHALWSGAGGDYNAWCIHWSTASGLGFCGGSTGGGSTGGGSTGGGGTIGPTVPTSAVPLGPITLNVNYPSIPLPGGSVDLNEIITSGRMISIGELVIFVFGVALWLGGILAFISLVYAGFLYIYSGENPGKRGEAKRRLENIVWGMGILLFSFGILTIINPRLTDLTFSSPAQPQICAPGESEECIPRFNAPTLSRDCTGTGPLKYVSNESAENDCFVDCLSTDLSFPDDGEGQITRKECMIAKGAIIVEADDFEGPLCAGVCMMESGDPLGCRLNDKEFTTILGRSGSCTSAWNDMNPGTATCQNNATSWQYKDPVCSGIGTSNGQGDERACSTCSPDDADFYGDTCASCVSNYIGLSVDTGWNWSACFCGSAPTAVGTSPTGPVGGGGGSSSTGDSAIDEVGTLVDLPPPITGSKIPAARLAFLDRRLGFAQDVTGGANGEICTVNNLNNSGAGSLRDCAAKENQWIVFGVSGKINLGGLKIPANTTIDGRGANITIDGTLNVINSNIIIENITIDNVVGNVQEDAIAIHGTFPDPGPDRVWIDHVTFVRAPDELLPMWAHKTSTTAPQDVTITWNYFQNHVSATSTQGMSHGMLIGSEPNGFNSAPTRATLAYNLWETGSRQPTIGDSSRAHLFNNVHARYIYGTGIKRNAKMLIENEIFDGTKTPNSHKAFAYRYDPDIGDQVLKQVGSLMLGGATGQEIRPGNIFSVPYSYSLLPANQALYNTVLTEAGALPPSSFMSL